jgi:hypothetical protein
MVRQFLRSVVLILAAWPVAVHADVRALYTGVGGDALVEVDDNGDSRLGGVDGESYSLFTAAGDFVVFRQDGALVAARYEDFQAVLAAMAAPLRGAAADATRPPPKRPAASPLTETGTEKVAGYEGRRFEWVEHPGGARSFAIVSNAPELKPLGRAMAKLLEQMPSFAETMTGERPPALVALAEMVGSAALLRLDEQATLAEVSFEPVPEDRFRIPATVLSRDEVAAMLGPGEPAAE